ncbi:MAG: hypothetical protein HKO99_11365 [Xanthomonadales bacterium]|nr:hypothetical protein [Gammaproteobacteria bacterium]MBT8051574.1 hypothetical protein [Gammaproteobacteria bacterium]NNK52184.1 hypothetical protein [Xanthomonadales bacterium]
MQVIQGMIVILLAVAATAAAAAGPVDPLFQDQSTLKVEITAPLSTLVRDRPEDQDLPGTFSYTEADGTPVELDVQVRARGNFRHRNCDFPPVTLNFRRSQVAGTLFDQQNKLKVVGHCKITSQYEQSVVREYLAYRILNSVTDLSFRVRLLQVTWVDSDERRGRMVRNAFLIEHKNRLAARIGMQEQEIEYADVSNIAPDQLNLDAMFQYLIGNFDFSPIAGSNNECCHNYAMFGSDADSLVAIPFDFDFAGIVNAPNAVPNSEMGVSKIGQRAYHGYCANNDYVEGSISAFKEVRDELYSLVADQPELEPNVREAVARYMDGFYEIVDDPLEVERKIIGNCK